MEAYEKEHFKAMLKKRKKVSNLSILKSYFGKENKQKDKEQAAKNDAAEERVAADFGFVGKPENRVYCESKGADCIELPIQQSFAKKCGLYTIDSCV
jgi:hypothetical protein